MSQTTIPLEKSRVIHVPRDREMAAKVKHIESLREKKKRDAASTQALIDEELDDLNALADVVLNAEQVDLPFEEEATEALAKIASLARTPAEALACPVHGDCSCIQPEVAPPGPLMCAFCTPIGQGWVPQFATCMGHSAEESEGGTVTPACDTHCKHEQVMMKCRPITEEDQPKLVPPMTAPSIKSMDCPLHGVNSLHGQVIVPPEEAEALAAEMPPDPEEPGVNVNDLPDPLIES